MNYKIKLLAFFLCVTLNIAAQTPAATIPSFNFVKQDKSAFTNKNLVAGKMIFFVFFDASCDHCQHAIQYINEHQQDFNNAAVYLITIDNPTTTELFLNKYGSNLKSKKNVTVLRDINNEFIRKFGPRKYPSMFLYSAQQKLLLYDDEPKNLIKFSNQIKVNGK